jgi:hypothetical protein
MESFREAIASLKQIMPPSLYKGRGLGGWVSEHLNLLIKSQERPPPLFISVSLLPVRSVVDTESQGGD